MSEQTMESGHIKRVVVESPNSGDIERNVEYALECLHDHFYDHKNELPILSHLLYTRLPKSAKESIDDVYNGHVVDNGSAA